MWTPFVFDNKNYLIRIDEGNIIKTYLTDFEKIWLEENSSVEIIARFKDNNPLFEDSDEEILKQTVTIIKNVKIINKLEIYSNELNLVIKTKIAELPITISFIMLEGSPQIFLEQVTINLIKSIQYLELKQNKLSELVLKKDKEIQEYNMEFGEISRKIVITPKYENPVENTIDDLVTNIFSKSDEFCEILFKKHGDIQEKFPELRKVVVEKKPLKLPNLKKKKRPRV